MKSRPAWVSIRGWIGAVKLRDETHDESAVEAERFQQGEQEGRPRAPSVPVWRWKQRCEFAVVAPANGSGWPSPP